MGEKLDQLKKEHAEKLATKENLRKKSEEMEIKLDRAGKLVTGLAGERVRWEQTVTVRHAHTHRVTVTHTHKVHIGLHKCIKRRLGLRFQHECVFNFSRVRVCVTVTLCVRAFASGS